MLTLIGGEELYELLENLPNTGSPGDYSTAVRALNKYFDPQTNTDVGHCNMRQAVQGEDESIDAFHICLRRLVHTWVGIDRQEEVRAQLIAGCRSGDLRRQIL